MKNKMYKSIKIILMLFALLIATIALNSNTVEAKTIKVKEPTFACKSGKYIYYAHYGSDLMRLDTKTNKKKVIYKSEHAQGFEALTIKGKYIYVQYNMCGGTGPSNPYIYRISKNGKKAEMLAQGSNPVIVGKKIYYNEVKQDEYDSDHVNETGRIKSMSLIGKKQKIEKNIKIKLTQKSAKAWDENKKVKVGKYTYYISDDNLKLYRKTKKTKKVIFKCSKKKKEFSISNFVVLGDYILLSTNTEIIYRSEYDFYDVIMYKMKTTGKGKKVVTKYFVS